MRSRMPRSPSSGHRWTPEPPTAPVHGSALRASAAPRTSSAPTATSSVSTCASSWNMVDIGDVFTTPETWRSRSTRSARRWATSIKRGVFPVILGGDHSIGYPTIRGMAPYVDGNIGIIHFDRHVDTQETDLDERMHTTPWFHATNLKNAPATNLVQIGIGGWQSPRAGVKVGRERGTTIMTVGDVERVGIEKIAETALEIAWKDAKAVDPSRSTST